VSQRAPQSNTTVSAALAFFLGIFGADLFYRREFSLGAAVVGILIASYALAAVLGPGGSGLLSNVPVLLVVYGWVRAFMYIRSKGL
jgi:hypothetical protein